MRAMRAETFSGYEALKLVEVAKPTISDGRVLVRITVAGVTPLDSYRFIRKQKYFNKFRRLRAIG
jgi:NADPH:quinone reductase-like Zn-dependent oxidoreductase